MDDSDAANSLEEKMDVLEATNCSEEKMELDLLDMPVSIVQGIIKRKEPATLVTLPRDLTIKLLDYCITNVKSMDNLSKVCPQFKELFTHQYFYSRIKILPEDKLEDVIDIFKQHTSAVKCVEMYDLTGKKMSIILKEMRILENLRSLTMVSTLLRHVRVSDVVAVVNSCSKLSAFKASEGLIHERNCYWKSVLNVLSTRQMVELTYDVSPAYGKDVTLVCRNSHESLKSLSFVTKFRGLSVDAIGECKSLESLRLELQYVPDGHFLCIRGLCALENLVSLSLEVSNIIVPDLTGFFSRPCAKKLKIVELNLAEFDRKLIKTFNTISNVCTNLQKFSFETLILPFVCDTGYFIPAASIMNLLQNCESLESVIIAPINLLEVRNLDKFIHANYRHIVPFNLTSYVLSQDIHTVDSNIPFIAHLDYDEYIKVMKRLSDSFRAQLNCFGVRHIKKKCYLEIFEFFRL